MAISHDDGMWPKDPSPLVDIGIMGMMMMMVVMISFVDLLR
jgi:hypothetical protein